MANVAMRVSPAIEEYLLSCAARGDRVNTIRSKRQHLDKLLNEVGNILLKNVRPDHIDAVFAACHKAGNRGSSINVTRAQLTTFFNWAKDRRYITSTATPMAGTRRLKEVPRQRLIIPAAKFGHLLNSAAHPRDRAVVALGLYLFPRQSEVRLLTIGDVQLDAGTINMTIPKTSQRDAMPICSELDEEMRAWLTHYADVCGSLDPSWALIPTRGRPVFRATPGVRGFSRKRLDDGRVLHPDRPLKQIESAVQDVLVRAGFSIVDEMGKLNFEGMHTLRRSGARALFDERVAAGYDGAIREVQAMLHHKTITMTEHYLGLQLDVNRRDRNIRGKAMFASLRSDNVITLDRRTGRAVQ